MGGQALTEMLGIDDSQLVHPSFLALCCLLGGAVPLLLPAGLHWVAMLFVAAMLPLASQGTILWEHLAAILVGVPLGAIGLSVARYLNSRPPGPAVPEEPESPTSPSSPLSMSSSSLSDARLSNLTEFSEDADIEELPAAAEEDASLEIEPPKDCAGDAQDDQAAAGAVPVTAPSAPEELEEETATAQHEVAAAVPEGTTTEPTDTAATEPTDTAATELIDTAVQEAEADTEKDGVEKENKVHGITWQEDKEVKTCPVCNDSFGLFTRRHHCRFCGLVVCGDCSDQTQMHQVAQSPQRICEQCVRKQAETVNTEASQTPEARQQVEDVYFEKLRKRKAASAMMQSARDGANGEDSVGAEYM